MKNLIIFLLLFSLSNTSSAQGTLSQNLHQFDFWIGEWNVYKYGTDVQVGVSSIKPIHHHTTIEENYQTVGGNYIGKSLNKYIATTNEWEQYWVDDTGVRLLLKGQFVDGRMILSDCDTTATCNKIIWTGLDDSTVRQEWMQSIDYGKSWNKIFDGHYKPRYTLEGVSPAFLILKDYTSIRDLAISSNGKEAYISIQSPLDETSVLGRMELIDGVWHEPVLLNFKDSYRYLEPFLSHDDSRLYFVSDRPINPESNSPKDYDIWYVERVAVDSSWSAPINLGPEINTSYDEFYPSLASNENIYFTRKSPETLGEDDIFMSRWMGDYYDSPKPLSSAINSIGYEYNSYIAPDESYIIFGGYRRFDGLGSGDLYISYKSDTGEWSVAKNMGSNINSEYMDYCPFVDQSTKTLYFTSKRSDIKPAEYSSLQNYHDAIDAFSNGQSRLYKIKWSTFD